MKKAISFLSILVFVILVSSTDRFLSSQKENNLASQISEKYNELQYEIGANREADHVDMLLGQLYELKDRFKQAYYRKQEDSCEQTDAEVWSGLSGKMKSLIACPTHDCSKRLKDLLNKNKDQ